jgi:L-ribulokinase
VLKPYVIGIDFGTLSARAVLVDSRNGKELASAVCDYPHGVIQQRLGKVALKPQSAFQDPRDYFFALRNIVPEVLRASGVQPSQVGGVGTDFTSCTVLPVDAKGRPLCADRRFASDPNAWVKLWKHHSPQKQADKINELGKRRDEPFLKAYGGKYSSEWFVSKVLETIEDSPAVYKAAARFIEAADWIVWQLTGNETRSVSAAGFKGMRVCDSLDGVGYPDPKFFKALNPGLANMVQEKIGGRTIGVGESAGGLLPEIAAKLGLEPGIPVVSGNIDAHAAVPACGVTTPGKLVMIMGTSTCHLLIGNERHEVEGICGVVRDGIVPGYWGYEAGQAGVGDMLAWYVERSVPEIVAKNARAKNMSVHELLSREAAGVKPGRSGLLALDWWNGNRSILVNADLTGLILGLNLETQPHEIYRALIEATAFGTRQIVEAFTGRGIAIRELYACGGLAQRNPVLMQIYADVLQRPIKVAGVQEASAFGSAMFAAVAAGLHKNVQSAARAMAPAPRVIYKPNPKHRRIYDALFAEYKKLHDYFGRGENPVMNRLTQLRGERL